jgi:superfamily II DNA or RNA helicase
MAKDKSAVNPNAVAPAAKPLELRYRGGTVELYGLPQVLRARDASPPAEADKEAALEPHPSLSWDARAGCHRAAGLDYAPLVMWLIENKIAYEDQARRYQKLPLALQFERTPRPYQKEALEAWDKAAGRGVVVLPTGSGKSFVAQLAIEQQKRPTLVVAPTLDLVRQWYDLLRQSFGLEVGIIGGGEYSLHPLTVTTYDSAHLQMEQIGNRFGLVVFDECHHLPAEAYALAAEAALAPFRLGLTATPERQDGREALLETLIGPTCYRRDIVELSGRYLAEYDVRRVVLELDEDEREEYQEQRKIYIDYLRQAGIRFSDPGGWSEFIMRASQSDAGRRAMDAHRRQKQLAFAARAKLAYLDDLLDRHAQDRAIIFTQDNATAYRISRRFLLPVITHQTKVSERSDVLDGLREGRYGAIVTSKVLNEGVDIPSANVAVVVSGSGSVREHVQRLGRVLRKQEQKHAVLYELVTAGTSETYTSDARREHSAYR